MSTPHLYNACLVVCVLGQAAQSKCSHFLQGQVSRRQHADEGRHTPALHDAGLVVCVCRQQHDTKKQDMSVSKYPKVAKLWSHHAELFKQVVKVHRLPNAGIRTRLENTAQYRCLQACQLHETPHGCSLPGPSSLGVCVANWPSSNAASRWLSGQELLSRLMTGCSAPSCSSYISDRE